MKKIKHKSQKSCKIIVDEKIIYTNPRLRKGVSALLCLLAIIAEIYPFLKGLS